MVHPDLHRNGKITDSIDSGDLEKIILKLFNN